MTAALALIARPLAAIGRLGTGAVAMSLFLGMALPPVSALVKPVLPVTVFLLLALSMIRIDPAALTPMRRAPARMAAILGWTMLAVPILVTGTLVLSGLPQSNPDLTLAIALMAAAPPIMSVPAFCFLLGLNGTLSFLLMTAAMVIAPLTTPLASWLFLGETLPVSPLAMAIRLTIYLAGSLALAAAIRRVVSLEAIRRNTDMIDGINVVLLFVFAVALMDGVAAVTLETPLLVAGLIALSFVVAGAIIAVTTLAFWTLGARDALSVGLTAGNRNMGLMASVLVASLPDLTWVYFALAQFPIYLLPVLMRPIARRIPAG